MLADAPAPDLARPACAGRVEAAAAPREAGAAWPRPRTRVEALAPAGRRAARRAGRAGARWPRTHRDRRRAVPAGRGQERRQPAADEPVRLRPRRAARAGRGRGERAAGPDVLRALPAGPHRRSGPGAGPRRAAPAGPRRLDRRRARPRTLSGGETFAASLALALGLADVVTAEAGGTLLETLFVDEGFGSLDDETLDEVMGVLDGLREGGRTVGIVSHVADLRQRIPVQLRVEKGRAGSHVRCSEPAPSAAAGLRRRRRAGRRRSPGAPHRGRAATTGEHSSPPRRTTRRSRPGWRWPTSWRPSTTSPT